MSRENLKLAVRQDRKDHPRLVGAALICAFTAIAVICAAMTPGKANDSTLDSPADFVQAGSP